MAFERHRKSSCHKESTLKWNHHLQGKDISTQLEKQVNVEQAKNRNCLKKIFTSLQYLAM